MLKEVRGRGLWAGAEIDPEFATARQACEALLAKGVLSKETHHTVVRLAPPLMIARGGPGLGRLDRVRRIVIARTVGAQRSGRRRKSVPGP